MTVALSFRSCTFVSDSIARFHCDALPALWCIWQMFDMVLCFAWQMWLLWEPCYLCTYYPGQIQCRDEMVIKIVLFRVLLLSSEKQICHLIMITVYSFGFRVSQEISENAQPIGWSKKTFGLCFLGKVLHCSHFLCLTEFMLPVLASIHRGSGRLCYPWGLTSAFLISGLLSPFITLPVLCVKLLYNC